MIFNCIGVDLTLEKNSRTGIHNVLWAVCFRFCVLCDLLSDWWFIISTFSPSTARNLNNNIFYWILVSGPQWSDPAVEGRRVSSCLVSEFQWWTHNTAGGTQGQGEGHQNYFRQLQWDMGKVVEWRMMNLLNYLQCCRVVFCKAYEIGLYGDKIQWLIVGGYSPRWWHKPMTDTSFGLNCSSAQVTQNNNVQEIFLKCQLNY